MTMNSATRLSLALLAMAFAGTAAAGDVGGNLYSSPGTVGLRLQWGANLENSRDILVTGDGAYRFGVNLPDGTPYRVVGQSAPAGWACRGKQGAKNITAAAATGTHVYCGTSASTNGVRVGVWNLEWYDSADPVAKKKAIAALINQYNFDVLVLNEVLDAASWREFITNHLGNAANWDFRISSAGCSLRQVTMWRKSAVTLESGYDLRASNTAGLIDEEDDAWADCGGRRPYVANFAVNGSALKFSTATIHFKAFTTPTDCQIRKDQVDSFVQWVNWSGMDKRNFIALGDFNDRLPGTGNCATIDTLASMENHPAFFFATAQPDYRYSFMMGNGLVTYDTDRFQNTIDHIWLSQSLLNRMQDTDTYRNGANAVQANMYFTTIGEPDHNLPYISLAK